MVTWQVNGRPTLPSAEQINEEIRQELAQVQEPAEVISGRAFERVLRACVEMLETRREEAA
jgi:NifB/MoaA-like Fe-S oxidoreductase